MEAWKKDRLRDEGGLASAGVVFTGQLAGLAASSKACARTMLRVLLMHLGCGHSLRESRASAAGLAELSRWR